MAVIGYENSVLLNLGKKRAGIIIEYMKDNFFDSKKAGLTLACYKITNYRG